MSNRELLNRVEGRLGRELVRIRTLFEEMEHGSMVVLDELCSGTNPSEGIEVFTLVLQLLRRVQPVAYVTTHFLDHARALQQNHAELGLEFLQVQLDDERRSTYQFVDGVAGAELQYGTPVARQTNRIRGEAAAQSPVNSSRKPAPSSRV